MGAPNVLIRKKEEVFVKQILVRNEVFAERTWLPVGLNFRRKACEVAGPAGTGKREERARTVLVA